jgi:altronate dehydratase small subunit
LGRKAEAIVMSSKDNVATALEALRAGAVVAVGIEGRTEKVPLVSDIPMGHKFALRDMEKDEPVIKYGESIGRSRVRIARGEHVHVQNVASQPRGGA